MKRALRTAMSLLLGLAAILVARADDFWKHKPPSEWTAEEALQILRDSPWAKQETVAGPPERCDPQETDQFGNCREPRMLLPRDRSGLELPVTRFEVSIYLVRWDSAPEVVAAFARLEELGAHASAAYQSPPPRRPPDRYVITMNLAQPPKGGGNPLAVRENDKEMKHVRLKTSRGTFTPVETERSGVGANEAVHFFFPREQDGKPILDPHGDTAEFVFEGRKVTVKTKFSLDAASLR